MSEDTVGYYNANAEDYVLLKNEPEPRLIPFLKRCKAKGTILELGTGGGADAAAIIKAGFKLDATDGSRELASIASHRLGHPVRTMLFHELNADNAYDGVYACASLTHTPRLKLEDTVSRVHRALSDGGVAWASFKLGTGEGLDMFGRYYNYPTEDQLFSLWEKAAPWSAIEAETWQGSGYDRKATHWMAITAIK